MGICDDVYNNIGNALHVDGPSVKNTIIRYDMLRTSKISRTYTHSAIKYMKKQGAGYVLLCRGAFISASNSVAFSIKKKKKRAVSTFMRHVYAR